MNRTRETSFDNKTPFPWVQIKTHTYQPFLYAKMIYDEEASIEPGSMVSVYTKYGELWGYGYYNPSSLIRVRMMAYPDEMEGEGEEFLWKRIQSAILWRERLQLSQYTEAYRLIHAEGDRVPGLILERYGKILVGEIFSRAIFVRRALLEQKLLELTKADALLWRADEKIQSLEGFRLDIKSSAPSQTVIREHGLRFRIDLQTGHKTGFFCDQRENRKKIIQYTPQQSVLDVCSYTGGFGIYAKVLGNAEEVTCVDLDEKAIELGKQNANLNQAQIHFTHADIFPYLRQMKENKKTFGVVIVDPPKFIGDRDSFVEGRQKYLDLNKLSISVVRPEGILVTCSCSGLLSLNDFIDVVKQASHIEKRKLQLLEWTGPGADHPVMLDWPEASYLKVLWFRVF
ncbi:MAG: class I SAM-dependent rRNA methyltransferase [Planctomycetota bacterium]